MSFAPDGRYLATYSNTDSHISFWQVSRAICTAWWALVGRASYWAYLPLFLCAPPPSLTQRSSVQITDYVLSASLQGTGNTVNNLAKKERVLSQDFTLKEAWEP